MWSSFFHDGGWGMYPTSLFGFLLVAAAVLLAIRPERRSAALVVCLAVTTLGAGLLGTCVGIVHSLRFIHQVPLDRQVAIASMGVAESLNNLVLSLLIVVPSSLIAAVGAVRAHGPAADAAGGR